MDTRSLQVLNFENLDINPSETMDQMDVDHVADVPDTPDRLTAQNRNGKSILDRQSSLSMSGLGNRNLLDGASKTQSKVNDNGVRKFLECASFIAVPSTVSDQHSSSNFDLGNSSSANNSSIPQRRVIEDISSSGCNHFVSAKNNKMAYAQSPALEGGPNVDLKERNGACKKILPFEAPGISRAEKNGKKLPSVIRSSSSHINASSPIISCFSNKGKEVENTCSGFNHGNMVNGADNSQPKFGNGKIVSPSLSYNTTHRVSGQKRLVRNGCISPHNIARVKESVGKEKMESDVQRNLTLPEASSSPLNKIGGKELVHDDLGSLTSKGKGIMRAPLTVKEPEAKSTHVASRNSVSISEIVKEVGNIDRESFRSSEELCGWRTIRNQSKLVSLPSSHGNWRRSREKGDCLISESRSNMVKRGETGSGVGISHNSPMDLDVTSNDNASLPPGGQRASHHRPELGRFVGHHPAATELTKRQKQRVTSSRNGECSRAAFDSSDIVFLGSSGNPQRTCETRSRNHLDSSVPIIEIDEVSPAARGDGSSNQGSNSNAADAMVKQIEADEMLARELQEQLYNEVNSSGGGGGGGGEMDAHLALTLQQGYELSPGFPRRRNGSNARRSTIASSSRQPQSSTPPILSRRGYQSRAPTVNRMARLRNRFPGRPRTLSSVRERDSLFPAEMDVDLRMHILEALEAIDEMGVDHSLLQTQRDFNENDYEMLLALDENNHRHGGASTSQINGLPESTVQNDNLEEACAICLDTPTTGDIIRHLPCLHKFHKDCIDPWLKRRTSCPVCKSSIT